MYNNTELWEMTVPADLIPAVKHLRESFEEAHWGFGWTAQKYCYAELHGLRINDPTKEYLNYLMYMKVRVGAVATQRFHDLIKLGTSPAIFKAFFDLYIDGVTVQALLIFEELKEIGRANRKRLAAANYLEWAEAQTKHLIRSDRHNIPIWIRAVCDVQVYDPQDDDEERIFWRKWQAPMFLIMTPSRYQPYDAQASLTRTDSETSSQWLEFFTKDYVLRLESRVGKAAGAAVLNLAKNPGAVISATDRGPLLPNVAATAPPITRSARREVRKADSQARYKLWKTKYRELKKNRPDMSDVWFSQQIARLAIAERHSAETIRKHMTK